MSDKSSAPAGAPAQPAGTQSSSNASGSGSAAAAATKKPLPEQNPALKMMGLPRFRLPSRNWMIFLSITGSIAAAVTYDKWQTKRTREKWCKVVSHLANESLDPKVQPRRVTIYLAAPPGDGLRAAREHFHTYVKPILVAAAMDWDVIEGRREGDVRHKTAEKIRTLRKKSGEGDALSPEEEEKLFMVDRIRERNGETTFPGVAGDIIIGRHTWKEYIRGIHEGYLGPADMPPEPNQEEVPAPSPAEHTDGHSSIGDAASKAATNIISQYTAKDGEKPDAQSDTVVTMDQIEREGGAKASKALTEGKEDESASPTEEKKDKKEAEEEKPKRRFPPSPILPNDYQTGSLAASTPEIIGPSVGIRFPHLLGIRNTPTRLYRYFTLRNLMDTVGRQVASAILASHRPYATMSLEDGHESPTTAVVPEQQEVLAFEQRDWWKTVNNPREEHEESVWIEPMSFDERITSRMRAFELTSEDESRAKAIAAGSEVSTARES